MILFLLSCIGQTSSSPWVFNGGTSHELARSLRTEFKSRVAVVFVGDVDQWPKFIVKSHDPKDRARLLNLRAHISCSQGDVAGVGPGAWPRGILHRQVPELYLRRFSIPVSERWSNQDGISASGEASAYTTLEELSKRVTVKLTWHYFFKNVRFYVDADHASQQELLKSVASAIGAKLVTKGQTANLEIDAATFQRRAVAFCEQRLETLSDPEEITSARFDCAVYQNASLDDIVKTYQKKEDQFPDMPPIYGRWYPKGTAMHTLALAYILGYHNHSDPALPDENYDKPIWAVMTTAGSCRALVKTPAGYHGF